MHSFFWEGGVRASLAKNPSHSQKFAPTSMKRPFLSYQQSLVCHNEKTPLSSITKYRCYKHAKEIYVISHFDNHAGKLHLISELHYLPG